MDGAVGGEESEFLKYLKDDEVGDMAFLGSGESVIKLVCSAQETWRGSQAWCVRVILIHVQDQAGLSSCASVPLKQKQSWVWRCTPKFPEIRSGKRTRNSVSSSATEQI